MFALSALKVWSSARSFSRTEKLLPPKAGVSLQSFGKQYSAGKMSCLANAIVTYNNNLNYSKLQYGILTWGSAKKNELGALSTRLNKMIKTITFAKEFCHVSLIFKALNLLKIDDIYQLELGKFMYQTFNGNIPQKIDKGFIKLSSVHKHYTRHTINKFHLPRVNTCYGHKMLSFAGVKLWSKLDLDLKSLGWLSFKKHFKRKLLEKYDD